MKLTTIIRTKQLLDDFQISRQTLYNWVKNGDLSEPEKDWRGWRMWTEQHVQEIDTIIRNKQTEQRFQPILEQKLKINNRRYLGSKYKLLDFIEQVVRVHCSGVSSVADVFGGTGVVADRFNRDGKTIIVNDILHSNYLSYLTWFGDEQVNVPKLERLIHEFNESEPTTDNYVSIHFGGTYFTERNARKIGFIREAIEQRSEALNTREKAVLITSLLYAMDKVANTVGHYDAYRRKLDSLHELRLLVPEFHDALNHGNELYKEDANQLVRRIRADLFYIDTPYNSRQYGDAYHLLENIAEWEQPELVGVAKKMVDRSHIKSDYCTMKAASAFEDLISNIDGRYILVSYNNMAQKGVGRSNAKISSEEIVEILQSRGTVNIFETNFQAFTTGKTNIDEHKELLYLCTVNKSIS